MEKLKIDILIPAYQEAGRIGRVVSEAKIYGHVWVVDDGSTDSTAHEALSAGAEVIRQTQNQGKGSAVRSGLDTFLNGNADAVILMDADGQHDPREIPRFIEKAVQSGAWMVIGNRMEENQKMPQVRKITNRVMSKILSMCSGVRVPDSQCGFRLIRREAVQRLNLHSSHFDIESELLLQTAAVTKKIENVRISTIYRGEKSKIHPLKDTIRFLKMMLIYLKPKFR